MVPYSMFFQMFIMFIGAIAVGGFSFILLMLLAITTPAMSYFKAKMKKNPLLAVRKRDKKIDYVVADQYIQGLATHKKYGGFIIDPNSVYTAQKGGVPVLPVNGEIGITLDPKILGIIDALKQYGIQNIEEAQFFDKIWIKCDCGYEGIQKYEIKDTNKGQQVVLYGCPYYKGEVKKDVKEETDNTTDGMSEQVPEDSNVDKSS